MLKATKRIHLSGAQLFGRGRPVWLVLLVQFCLACGAPGMTSALRGGGQEALASRGFKVLLATATLRCDGDASELQLKTEAKSVVAVRFEFQNGPLGFNVYRKIHLVAQPGN